MTLREVCGTSGKEVIAMMRRWHELWGSEATYLRLVEGLRN
jgi:hypothetical protein